MKEPDKTSEELVKWRQAIYLKELRVIIIKMMKEFSRTMGAQTRS